MSIRILPGDCRSVLATLPSASVQCVVTSPPYYGLRDYGTAQWDGGDAGCDHIRPGRERRSFNGQGFDYGRGCFPSSTQSAEPFTDACGKCGARRIDRQIGLEASPDEYLATMVAVFRQVRRVLREDGTCWVNMGDGHQSKQLLMMPARLALALQADGWWLRSDIIWHKPNPMPESVTDRPTSAHEHVFLLTKRATYYYDADAVREEAEYGRRDTAGAWRGGAYVNQRPGQDNSVGTGLANSVTGKHPETGRNLRNVWTIATAPYAEAHFATFPPALAERCIKAGTSDKGSCGQCGAPWARVVERTAEATVRAPPSVYTGAAYASPQSAPRGPKSNFGESVSTTNGWAPGCRCDAPVVPCSVLDPFAGAGTTLLVADRLQRNAVGIELNPEYTRLAMQRCHDDAPLFTSWAPADDPADARMADLFQQAAD